MCELVWGPQLPGLPRDARLAPRVVHYYAIHLWITEVRNAHRRRTLSRPTAQPSADHGCNVSMPM